MSGRIETQRKPQVWVFAGRKPDAQAWAKAQGLTPGQFEAFGNGSRRMGGIVFEAADRVVQVGAVSAELALFIRTTATKTRQTGVDVRVEHVAPVAAGVPA